MKKLVWFVILTYRPKVSDLVSHFRIFDGLSFILVDNSEARNEFPKGIPVLRTGNNLGYTGGMNRGIRYCMEQGATWIVATNDDLDVQKESLKELSEKLDSESPGVVGPFVGTLDTLRWTTMYPVKKFSKKIYVSGSCMAVHKNVIEKIGYFYEPYFMYYEDADLCVRARKAGFPLIRLPLTEISHDDTSSLGRGSFLHQYYLARNHLLFVERNAPLAVKIHELVRCPKTIWEHWKRGESGALIGIRDYFLRKFEKKT